MTDVLAYTLPGASQVKGDLTFCPGCSLRYTAMGCVLGGIGRPSSMDDAIARMALAQVERGLPVDTPIPVTVVDDGATCDACGRPLATQPEREIA